MQEEYNVETQQLLLCFLMSDTDLWTRVVGILKPAYFHQSLQRVVQYLMEYSTEYNTLPKLEQIENKTNVKLTLIDDMRDSDREWFLNNIETFCKRKALEQWLVKGPDYIDEGNFGALESGLKDALLLSLTKNIGTHYFADPKARLLNMQKNNGQLSTGWKSLDKLLYGGFNRGELNIFAAGSGGGKSLFLQNFAIMKAHEGLNVVYATFELAEDLVSMRIDSMISGVGSKEIYKKIDEVHDKVVFSGKKAGNFVIKYLAHGATTNDIKALLKEFELETGSRPDVVVVDYLDLVHPNDKSISKDNFFLKDKYVSEELRAMSNEMYVDHRLLLVTASQLGRSAVEEVEFSQANIAGGISKINTADNVIAIYSSKMMREQGLFQLQLLKTRNSAGVGFKVDLAFDGVTMRITDLDEDSDFTAGMVSKPAILDSINNKNKVSVKKPQTTEISSRKNILKLMNDMKK